MPHRLRLLWVTPYPPARGQSSARERFWALLARLARRHDVSLVTQIDDAERARPTDLPPGLRDVELVPLPRAHVPDPLHVFPREVRWGAVSPLLESAVTRRLSRERFDVVQWEFTEIGAIMPRPTVPTIVTAHQIGFAAPLQEWRARGRAAAELPRSVRRHLRSLHFELCALSRAHLVITMSNEDARRVRAFVPWARVEAVACGVDTGTFRRDAVPPAATTDLLFVGNFGHAPNRDAVLFFAREVLPRLARRDARLRVVGREMSADVTALRGAPAIDVVPDVDDVRPHLGAASVVIAPVRFGTGMRGKILEALAMGKAVVTTPLGAEGLGMDAQRALVIADGPAQWVSAIDRLLADPTLREQLGREGRDLVVRGFDWERIARRHEEIYEAVRGATQAPRCVPFRRPRRLQGMLDTLPGPVQRRLARVAGSSLVTVAGLRWYAGRPWR